MSTGGEREGREREREEDRERGKERNKERKGENDFHRDGTWSGIGDRSGSSGERKLKEFLLC